MSHEIPARSRLYPSIPITSPLFVYRHARQTDVRATFDRARTGLGLAAERRQDLKASRNRLGSDLIAPGIRRGN